MRLHSPLLVLSLACVPLCGVTQTVDLGRNRVPTVELHGLARFHTGDDPDGRLGWAKPHFDDTGWPVAQQGRWPEPAFDSSGFAWVRISASVRSDTEEPLALRVRGLTCA